MSTPPKFKDLVELGINGTPEAVHAVASMQGFCVESNVLTDFNHSRMKRELYLGTLIAEKKGNPANVSAFREGFAEAVTAQVSTLEYTPVAGFRPRPITERDRQRAYQEMDLFGATMTERLVTG